MRSEWWKSSAEFDQEKTETKRSETTAVKTTCITATIATMTNICNGICKTVGAASVWAFNVEEITSQRPQNPANGGIPTRLNRQTTAEIAANGSVPWHSVQIENMTVVPQQAIPAVGPSHLRQATEPPP